LKAWRITKKDYVADAFSGKGSFLNAGRWNSAGVRLVYLGGTPSISVLETLVNVQSLSVLATLEFVLIPVDFADSLIADVGPLPSDWNSFPSPISTATIGDLWVNSGRSLILKVPSAVLSLEDNYLLNPLHPDMNKVVIGTAEPIDVDIRIQRLYSRPPARWRLA
jgi:RES domain-containing protein